MRHRWIVRTAQGDEALADLLNKLEEDFYAVHTITETRTHYGPIWTVIAYND